MKLRLLLAGTLAALLTGGCSNLLNLNQETTPTPVSTTLTTGPWTSISSATTMTNTCTNFRWTITEVTASDARGTFTATCMETMQVAGTAHGILSADTVTWTAQGTGTTAAGASCAIALAGSATFDGTNIRIPYSGTTCLGPIAGAEILRRI